MSKKTMRKVPAYIVKTADEYSLICYISSFIEDIAKFLNVDIKEVKDKLNTAGKIGNYRVALIHLKYKKGELIDI